MTQPPDARTPSEARPADRPRGHSGTTETEQLIFDATERVLAEVPFHEVSVARILKEAGVSRATFYFYFSSKFAVITGLLVQVMDDVVEAVQPFLTREPDTPPDVALRDSFAGATKVWREHRLVLRAVSEHWHEVPELRDLWTSLWDRSRDLLAALLDTERKRGVAPPGPDSRQLAAALLWGAERALYIAGLETNPELPDEEAVAESLVTIWYGALYGSSLPPVAAPGRRASARRGRQ